MWSSLISVHIVCLYAKIGLKRFEKFARIFSRRHKQPTFADAGFLGILRVNFIMLWSGVGGSACTCSCICLKTCLTFVIRWLSSNILNITKTCLYNFDPLKPHFYIVKLGFAGVYIIFLSLHKNIDCGYLLEPPRRGGSYEYPQSMFWAEIWKISELFFIWKFSVFLFRWNFLNIWIGVFS